MKKYAMYIFGITAVLMSVSCAEVVDNNAIKRVSLSCETLGFADGVTYTEASWCADEKICVFRADDWSSAYFTISEGVDSSAAKFEGEFSSTNAKYYAVRPAAEYAVRSNGEIAIDVKAGNIFLKNENSSMVTPQIGVGNKNGLRFISLFGALKIELSGVEQVSMVGVDVLSRDMGLYGEFVYNFLQNTIRRQEVEYSVLREFETPLTLAATKTIYVALPAGKCKEMEILVRGGIGENGVLYSVKNIDIKRGEVTDATVTPASVSYVVGGWHVKSLGGVAVDADIYLDFDRKGGFTIYQRTEDITYTTFEGTYTIDEENSTISGIYSDGSAWADSYKFSMNREGNLLLKGVKNSSDVTEYEPADMPISATRSLNSLNGEIVKPL